MRSRFSADTDFSVQKAISAHEVFFEVLESALKTEFFRNGYFVFDFFFQRKPKIKKEGAPNFWSGWAVGFKLVLSTSANDSIEQKRREAIIPVGATTSVISLDISEYEYCGSVETIKVKNTDVRVYSRTLLLLEKMRAICQQHPDYPLKAVDQRARDYYDIERLWNVVLTERAAADFIADCAKHIEQVFAAKGVDIGLLAKIFDEDFVSLQKAGWSAVEATTTGKLEAFDYYNESLKTLAADIWRFREAQSKTE